MQIRSGLFDHQVLQRNAMNVCDAVIAGACAGSGIVRARVSAKGKALAGLADVKVGQAARGKFTASLKGMGVGGPYAVTLRVVAASGNIVDETTVSDVLVGDVWLLGGQSNMQGSGRRAHRAKPHKMVRAFYMDDRWGVAEDPLHNLWAAVDFFHNGGVKGLDDGLGGVGPGVAFGQELYHLSGVPQGLIACAHGGTSMAQWDPALKSQGGRSLFGAMCRRLQKNGRKVAGMAWYQGCSDRGPKEAAVYTQRMKKLVAAVRREVGDPMNPWVVVQIGRYVVKQDPVGWNSIQDQQRRLPDVIANVTTVPAIDLALEDQVHISGRDQQRLGKRMARAIWSLLHGRKSGLPPITYRNAKIEKLPKGGKGDVVVTFDNVVGRLKAPGRPVGFDLMGADGVPLVYRVDLKGNQAILRATYGAYDLGAIMLHYGYGLNPVCNITDEADRSLPVFGPICLVKSRAMSDFALTMLLSDLMPSAGKLEGLEYPGDLAALGLKPFSSGIQFCHIHEQLLAKAPNDVLFYFAGVIECAEAMKVSLKLGYDGPVKVWLNGKEIFHDPNGTNPAVMDQRTLPQQLSAGRHELLVAMGSNAGKAWGIFLRMERKDVPLSLIRKGPPCYVMPQIRAELK